MKAVTNNRSPLRLSNILVYPTSIVCVLATGLLLRGSHSDYFSYHFNPYALLSGLEIVSNILLFIALYMRKGYVQARLWLAVVIAGDFLLGLGECLSRLSVSPNQAQFWTNVGTTGIIIIPIGFYMFALFFSGRVSRSRVLILPAIMFTTAVLLLRNVIEANTLEMIKTSYGFWGYDIPITPPFMILMLWLTTIIILGTSGLIRYYRTLSNHDQRAQVLIIVLGALISLGGAFFFDVLPRFLGYSILPIGVLFQMVLPICLIVAMYRYEAFDIDFTIAGADILDSLSEVVIITDQNYKVLSANAYSLVKTGLSQAELVGSTVKILFQDAFFKELEQAIVSNKSGRVTTFPEARLKTAGNLELIIRLTVTVLASTGNAYVFTINDISQDVASYTAEQQRNRELEAANQAFRDQQKAMLNLLEDSRDLSEQLAVEKQNVEHKVDARTAEVKAERMRLEASINSLQVGFIIVDSKLQIITANLAFRSIIGITTDKQDLNLDQLAQNLAKVYDVHKAIQHCLDVGHETKRDNLQFGNKVLRIFMAPIFEDTEARKSLGVVILVEDVTEAKAVERSRDEFFSIASHELRTPLTAIRGNTQMIKEYYKEALADESLAEMVNDIHDSSIRLITIVNDFLDTSRLEQGKINFQISNFDLKELADDVAQEFKAGAVNPELYIKVKAPSAGLPNVMADRDRLKQTIINMVGNAFKFTEHGGVTINITADEKKIYIAVVDTGKGIPAESQNLLFRKFQQASNNILTRDSTRSTGLGLYISKLIAEGMHGKIYLRESVLGKGSTFVIEMPIAPSKSNRLSATKGGEEST